MLFLIYHLGALAQKETVDAVVARLFFAVGMDSAASHHHHVGTLTNIKIVVYKVVHAAVRDAGRDIHLFPFCARGHADINAGLVCLGFYFDVSGRLAPGAAAVLPDIVGTCEFALEACHKAQQLVCYIIHARRTSLPSGHMQPMLSPIIR